MAKTSNNIPALCDSLISEIRRGVFHPVYLLMGDEPYYPDLVCKAIMENCLQDFEKDFNETVCYGADVNASLITTTARKYPMMADRQLVVVREAQMMKGIEDLAAYCSQPLDSTVLVLLMHNASLDKRKTLYKTISKTGVIVDSPALRDYEIPGWISNYYRSRGLQIDPQAAALLGESAGTDLSTIVSETDKLTKSLPEGCTNVTVADVEKNVGISRQFSVFELTKELSYRNASKALNIASHMSSSAKFAMPMAVSALFTHFNRILHYGALLNEKSMPSPEDKARALAGVNPYFYKEYDVAVRNYPVRKAMAAVSLLCEYDYLGKGGDGGAATPNELMMELTAKLLNL